MHPRLLVLDEPTSALDPTAAEEVLATLTRLVHDLGVSVLLAEHRLERVVPFADRMLPADRRRLACAVGEPADLLATSPVVPPARRAGPRRRLVAAAAERARRAAPGRRAGDRLPPPPDPPPRRGGRRGSCVRGLTVVHGRTVAVREVSLALPRGRVTALMGRNGSGKSSLLWALQGSGAAAAPGRSAVGGMDPAGLKPAERRALVGLLPQQAADLLYLETVDEECAAGGPGDPRDPRRARAGHPRRPAPARPLRGAAARRSRWPWCSPARPPVVLLDEPTRGLDYRRQARRWPTRCAGWPPRAGRVLVSTHDVEFTALAADEVVVLAEGEVVSSGPVRRVVAESPAFAPQVTKVLGPPWLRVDEVTRALEAVS